MKVMSEVGPIFSALWRSRAALILICLQIALTLAIVCNALNIISMRFRLMERPSGMNETDTFIVSSNGFGAKFDVNATTNVDMAMLRHLPGVVAAAPAVTVPLSGDGWTEDVYQTNAQRQPTSDDVAVYFTDDHGLDAYGVTLVAGRNFTAQEVSARDEHDAVWPAGVIISQALAQRLFPGEPAPGKQFYIDRKARVTVLGVIARLQAADAHHSNVSGDPDIVEYSIVVPQIFSSGNDSMYLVRSEPGRRDELMNTVESKLAASNPSRAVESLKTIQSLREHVYREDRAMMLILTVVALALLCVTAMGIAGLANFWVTQRRKQIGIRRALGAARGDILRHFQTENFIITTLGLILGSGLSYALSLWLVAASVAVLLPWYYVPVGFFCLWILGQIAVFGPALNASRVPPAIATKSD
jgi:putative ABC transport system permease protein